MNYIVRPYLLGIVLVLSLSNCTSYYDKQVNWQKVKPDNFPVLNAIGYAPISLQKSKHETQRMLMALNASKIAAYAELAEQVYGQQIDGQTTMESLLIGDQKMRASIRGIVRGAKVIKSYPVGDTYATELQLDFKDVYEIYIANSNEREIKSVDYY